MDITLDDREVEVLRSVLTNGLGDLRMEVSGTDLYEMREALKDDEAVLKRVLGKLGVTHPYGVLT